MRNELWDDAVNERMRKGLPKAPRGRPPPQPRLSEERLTKLRANQRALYPDPKDVTIRTGPDPRVEVAAQLGHSPTTTLGTYAHELEAFVGRPPIDIEDEIRRARRAA